MTNRKSYRGSLQVLALALLGPACGGAPTADAPAVGATQQAITVASTTDVVNSILAAAQQLQAATSNLNAVLSGAYAAWPSKADFQRSSTIRGYANDLDALNAAAFVSAAYAQGAYFNPSLNFVEQQQLGGAYTNNIGPAGAYVIGASISGAYVLPTGGIGGAYVSGIGSHGVAEKINRLNRE